MSATLQYLRDHLTACIEADPSMADVPVFLSKDEEGNEFRPTHGDFDLLPGEDIDQPGLERVAVIWPAW